MNARLPLADRIRRRISIDPESGCWIWLGQSVNGYGRLRIMDDQGKRNWFGAHRVSYEAFVGPIPEGLTLDHLCHVPGECAGGPTCPHRTCVNPAHLEPVTNRVNSLRSSSPLAEHARRTHCIAGHEFTPENTRLQQGRRSCLTCRREANRLVRQAARTAHQERKAAAVSPTTTPTNRLASAEPSA